MDRHLKISLAMAIRAGMAARVPEADGRKAVKASIACDAAQAMYDEFAERGWVEKEEPFDGQATTAG